MVTVTVTVTVTLFRNRKAKPISHACEWNVLDDTWWLFGVTLWLFVVTLWLFVVTLWLFGVTLWLFGLTLWLFVVTWWQGPWVLRLWCLARRLPPRAFALWPVSSHAHTLACICTRINLTRTFHVRSWTSAGPVSLRCKHALSSIYEPLLTSHNSLVYCLHVSRKLLVWQLTGFFRSSSSLASYISHKALSHPRWLLMMFSDKYICAATWRETPWGVFLPGFSAAPRSCLPCECHVCRYMQAPPAMPTCVIHIYIYIYIWLRYLHGPA